MALTDRVTTDRRRVRARVCRDGSEKEGICLLSSKKRRGQTRGEYWQCSRKWCRPIRAPAGNEMDSATVGLPQYRTSSRGTEVAGLGRGLNALLGATPDSESKPARHLPLSILAAWGPFQPAREIQEQPLEDLEASIKAQGVKSPSSCVVRWKLPTGGALLREIIAGGAALRAAKHLQASPIFPTSVRELTEQRKPGHALSRTFSARI